MLRAYHVEMIQLALGDTCSPQALAAIIQANLRQDRIQGQIGHDEFHFDNNAFDQSYRYMEEQRARTLAALRANDAPLAWSAFGRLTHTAQDFYAHSNYIALWLVSQPQGVSVSPAAVPALDPEFIHSPHLRSGRVHWLEVFTLIPRLRPLVMPLLPRDSHGWMNLDAPERGPGFPFAFEAAVKRTRIEFEKIAADLPGDLLGRFVGE